MICLPLKNEPEPFTLLIRFSSGRMTATRQNRRFLRNSAGRVRWFADPHAVIAAVRKHDQLAAEQVAA